MSRSSQPGSHWSSRLSPAGLLQLLGERLARAIEGELADLRNQLAGAVLMGFGGVTALGCTIGQGLAGVSTLAIGSFIALAGIIAGSVAALKYTLWREERGA